MSMSMSACECAYEFTWKSDRYRRTEHSHTDTNTISFSFCLMYTCFIITRLWYFFRCWLNEWFEIRIEARKKPLKWDEMRRDGETNKSNNKWKANKQRTSNKMSNVNPLNKSIHSIEKWGCEHQKWKINNTRSGIDIRTHTQNLIASRVLFAWIIHIFSL